jgi:uncharacterized delta-60 repeat protein
MRRLLPVVTILILGAALAQRGLAPSWAGPNLKPGSLDPGFGIQGKSVEDFPGVRDFLTSVVVQPDGRIVAAGQAEPGLTDFAVLRYLADGTLDPSFGGGDGKVTTDFIQAVGSYDSAWGVALQEDGRIVAAGYKAEGAQHDVTLARYLANGDPDPGFGGGDGKVITDFQGGHDSAAAVAIQPDGKIVVAGGSTTVPGNQSRFALARYLPGGDPDPDFGTGGQVVTPVPGGSGYAYALAILKNGKLVVAGAAGSQVNRDLAVARYLPDGAPDLTFDDDGLATLDLGTPFDVAYAVAIQKGGRILCAGTNSAANPDFILARFKKNGKPDPGFGDGGRVTTDFNGGIDTPTGIVLKGGKIVVAGNARVSLGETAFALARYLSNGKLDRTFGTNGRVETSFGNTGSGSEAIALGKDGNIVAVGGTWYGAYDAADFAVARYIGK